MLNSNQFILTALTMAALNPTLVQYQAFPFYGQQQQEVLPPQLNARMLELQLQQCCCNQITELNAKLSNTVNAAPVRCVSYLHEKENDDLAYKLDQFLFPDNPIRDYISGEIRKIEEKYDSLIAELDALLNR